MDNRQSAAAFSNNTLSTSELSEKLVEWARIITCGPSEHQYVPRKDFSAEGIQSVCKGSLRPLWLWMIDNVRSRAEVMNICDNLTLALPANQEKVRNHEKLINEQKELAAEEAVLEAEVEELEKQNRDLCNQLSDAEDGAQSLHAGLEEAAIRECLYSGAQNQWGQTHGSWEQQFQDIHGSLHEVWSEAETRSYVDAKVQTAWKALMKNSDESNTSYDGKYTSPPQKSSAVAAGSMEGAEGNISEKQNPKLSGTIVMSVLGRIANKSCLQMEAGIHPSMQPSRLQKDEDGRINRCQVIEHMNQEGFPKSDEIFPQINEILHRQRSAHVQKFTEAQRLLNEVSTIKDKLNAQGFGAEGSKEDGDLLLKIAIEKAALDTLKQAYTKLHDEIISFEKERQVLEEKVQLLGMLEKSCEEKDAEIKHLSRSNQEIYRGIKKQRAASFQQHSETISTLTKDLSTFAERIKDTVNIEVNAASKVDLKRLMRTHTSLVPVVGAEQQESKDERHIRLKVDQPDLVVKRAANRDSQVALVAKSVGYGYPLSFETLVERLAQEKAQAQALCCLNRRLWSEHQKAEEQGGGVEDAAAKLMQQSQEVLDAIRESEGARTQLSEISELLDQIKRCTSEDCAEFTKVVEEWWAQPGQYSVDWLEKNGRTISQCVSQIRKNRSKQQHQSNDQNAI